MSNRFLNAAVAVLATAAMVMTGIFVPKLLLLHTRQEMTDGVGMVNVEELTPYSSESELTSRIRKLNNMIYLAACYDMDPYLAQREPLDSELSYEGAVENARSFALSALEEMCRMGLDFPTNVLAEKAEFSIENYTDVQTYDEAGASDKIVSVEKESAAPNWDALGIDVNDFLLDGLQSSQPDAELLVSPESDTLSVWVVQFYMMYGSFGVILDSVTGFPVYLVIEMGSDGGEISAGEGYWTAIAQAYETLDSETFSFGGCEQMESTGMEQWSDALSGYESGEEVLYYSGSSGELQLELQEINWDGTIIQLVCHLYA